MEWTKELLEAKAAELRNAADSLFNVASAVKHLTEERVRDGWIPVGELYPKSFDDNVLVCTKDGGVYMGAGYWSEEIENYFSWCFDGEGGTDDVIAWMPLPEPYVPKDFAESVAKQIAENELKNA